MSGGSYDYLFSQDIEKLVSSSISKVHLFDSYSLLKELGVEDIAEDVDLVIRKLKAIDELISDTEDLFNNLRPILHDLEWFSSCDYSKEDVFKQVETYRKLKKVT